MEWQRVARAQDGAISTRQLASTGVSAQTASRMARDGELSRICRGIYLAGGAPPTYRARLWAAVLATDGVLGGATAGRLWGVLDDQPAEVDVIVGRDQRRHPPAWVRLHRADLPPGSVRVRSGFPATSRPQTVLDLLATLPEHAASRLADRALQRGWLTRRDIEQRLRDQPGRTGNVRLRRLAAQVGDGAAAESERRLHAILRAAGIAGWTPNFEVWAAGELVGVIDVAFPGLRLAVEVDGMAYHVDVDRFRGDRARQNALVALGWTVLRFTWADLTERPGYVVATIRRFSA